MNDALSRMHYGRTRENVYHEYKHSPTRNKIGVPMKGRKDMGNSACYGLWARWNYREMINARYSQRFFDDVRGAHQYLIVIKRLAEITWRWSWFNHRRNAFQLVVTEVCIGHDKLFQLVFLWNVWFVIILYKQHKKCMILWDILKI